jgi:hypothetical protein
LVGDEVQAAEGDLSDWLHLFHVIEAEDDPHLKHEESVRKGSYPACQLSEVLTSTMNISVCHTQNPKGSTRDTNLY